jgi:hypothetical protein
MPDQTDELMESIRQLIEKNEKLIGRHQEMKAKLEALLVKVNKTEIQRLATRLFPPHYRTF